MSIPMRGLVPLSLGLIVGCGGKIDEEEAEAVFGAMQTVNADVQVQASAASASAVKALTAEADGDGWSFSGTLDGGTGWSGTIAVDGAMLYASDDAGTTMSYELAMEYQDVEVSDLVLNGHVDLVMEMITSGSTGGFSYLYDQSGELDVDGDASGTATFAYTLEMTYDPATGTYAYSATGDINGHDVSGWAGSGASGAAY